MRASQLRSRGIGPLSSLVCRVSTPLPVISEPAKFDKLMCVEEGELVASGVQNAVLDFKDLLDGCYVPSGNLRMQPINLTNEALRFGLAGRSQFAYLGDQVVDHRDPCCDYARPICAGFVAAYRF